MSSSDDDPFQYQTLRRTQVRKRTKTSANNDITKSSSKRARKSLTSSQSKDNASKKLKKEQEVTAGEKKEGNCSVCQMPLNLLLR